MADRRVVAGVAVGVPLAFVGVVAVQALVATRGEYLPADVGYDVQARVAPAAGDADAGATPIRMAMLGDSTVAGVGSPTVDGSLVVQTAQRVADRTGRPVQAWGFGVSGARTADVRHEQAPQLEAGAFDVVVVVIGSNDTTHATPWWRFDDETRSMLASVRDQVGAPVVLGGIPLFGSATALGRPLRDIVDAYARPLRRAQRAAAAQVDGVTFVNIAVEASPRFRGVPDAMSSDGFHPAPVGYGFWADALAPAVVSALP